jgi:hypothetical protein
MTARNPAEHESDDSVNTGRPFDAAVAADVDADAGVIVQRPDDEDHDLLTFGEAGARLEEEVIKQRRVLERLREGGADRATIEGAQRRLDALERARARNLPPSLDNLKASGFFGPRP